MNDDYDDDNATHGAGSAQREFQSLEAQKQTSKEKPRSFLRSALSLPTPAVAASRRSGSLAGGGSSDWLPAPADARIAGDLCLGFNGGLGGGWPTTATVTTTSSPSLPLLGPLHTGGTAAGSYTGNSRVAHNPILNYNSIPLPFPHELSMVGLRDVFLFHHASPDPQNPVFLASSSSSSALPQNLPSMHSFSATEVDGDKRRVAEIQLWKAGVSGMGPEGGGVTCQDCGNQAKKDCVHRRCRTCCKSRGFDCDTHVKSTWVPAARRRERQQILSGGSAGAGVKKARLGTGGATTTASLTSTSAYTPSQSFDTGSSHHEMEMGGGGGGLPGHVTAPAVFRCVRVTAIEEGDDEYAYQAVVKIGGRVFKGFLYDQGLDDSSSSSLPNLSDLHLGDYSGSAAGGGSGKNVNASSLASILDATDAYAAAAAASSTGGVLGGSNYGDPIN